MATVPNTHRFHLVGSLEGQTINLGGHDFVDGVYEFVYVVDGQRVLPSIDDAAAKAVSLARNYQAYREGPELEEARSRLGAKEPSPLPHQGEGDVAKREDADQEERSERTVSSRKAATAAREALLKLDHKNDEHWTDAGLPSVAAVREIAGVETITRADITALAPQLNREEAKKVAEGAA
jgi:hypothetical protein